MIRGVPLQRFLKAEPNIICSTDKTVALKRQLVAGNYSSAHSCCHCQIFVISATIPSDDGEDEEFFRTSMQVDEVHRLARKGCRWFALFSNKIRSIAGDDGVEFTPWDSDDEWFSDFSNYSGDSDDWAHSENGMGENSVLISLRYSIREEEIYIKADLGYENHWHPISFYGIKQADADTYSDSRSFRNPINKYPGSKKSIKLVRSWLETCSVKHDCGIRRLPPSLPTFLLALRKNRVYLINTVRMPKVRYVALSYCWGAKGQKILLLKHTKRKLLNGVALEQFDPTLKEAMDITRRIGFQYIWIDALCIIQDDEEKKASELTRMSEIYRNATLTLISSGAAGVQDSFLSQRKTAGHSQPHLVFKLPHLDKNNPTIILVPKETIGEEIGEYTMENWSKRGWTLQEGITSPRRLRFGVRQTTWTCCHESYYMDNDGWIPTRYEESDDLVVPTRFHNQASRIVNHGKTGYQPEEIRNIWAHILHEYSYRRIKYQSDRLPAIASIAKGFAQALDDDYICGLWKADLHRGLLWHKNAYEVDGMSEDASGFQPSWSWASSRQSFEVDSQDPQYDRYEQVFKDSHFELVKYTGVPKRGGDKYGAMESATLHIKALIVSVPEAIINDRRADLLGLWKPLNGSKQEGRFSSGDFSSARQEQLLAEIEREKASHVNDLSKMLIASLVKLDNVKEPRNNAGHHPPRDEFADLSLLLVGHTGDEMAGGPIGLLICRERDENYRRIGYFKVGNFWAIVDGDEWERRGDFNCQDEEYRSTVLRFWGGETSLRQVALV
ncbi:HET-domain-containing protein [Nemania sp. NC0429]|nr:HET-domain-containing protein [Nemania sp. NC0429]